jgi:ketosteroid isomerase-like protein
MFNRLLVAVAACVCVGVGGWLLGRHGQAAEARADAELRQQLMDADRAFAKAAGEKGLDGWMSFMADDAVRVSPMGGKATVGKAAIRKLDANLFADANRQLVWEPADAGTFADGKHGFTTGRAKIAARDAAGKEESPWTVKYVTWWRKGEDGRWKVILDTGASEMPRP